DGSGKRRSLLRANKFRDQLGQQLREEVHDPRPSNQTQAKTERRQNRWQEVLDIGLGTLALLEVIEFSNESVASIIKVGEDGSRSRGGTVPQSSYFQVEFGFVLRQQGLRDPYVKLLLHRG
ncbi:MAG: hypothetical protein L0312_02260, partial [Acidobacteria bacterium]|nr:hypothetical protein [Acidobacteriota bacterium]